MGILASILMFANVENKLSFLLKLEDLIGERREYDRVSWRLREYNIDLDIPFFFQLEKIGAQRRLAEKSILGDEAFILKVDVPVEHRSFEGLWRVKDTKELRIFHYKKPEIENFAVMVTEHGSAAIKCALRILKKQKLYPLEVYVELPRGRRGLDLIGDLGNMGRIYISNVLNSFVKGAGLYGKDLQRSDVAEDLLRRGGKIKAAVLEDRQRNIKIVISSKGIIYSYRKILPEVFVEEIANIIEVFKQRNFIRLK